MSKLVLSGDTSGSVTLDAPAVSGTTTLTLPTTTGTLVVTSGAQTIEFADGSASAPSITNSGDTNTGMFFPAADTIAFAEGGTEVMRIDSAGNVGIGTASPSVRLHVSTSLDETARFTSSGNPYISWYSGATRRGYIQFDSTSTAFYNESAAPMLFGTNSTERMRLDTSGNLLFNSGYGSVATAYGCRAWVNFNGTGTVAIRGSGNVTSITDNGTGDYTVNFTNAMPDVNYAVTGMSRNTSNSGYLIYGNSISGNATGSVRISVSDVNVFADSNTVSVSIFR